MAETAYKPFPMHLVSHLHTARDRKRLISEYPGNWTGKNEDDEVFFLIIREDGMELTTHQDNTWIRINLYDEEGKDCGETLNGKWKW